MTVLDEGECVSRLIIQSTNNHSHRACFRKVHFIKHHNMNYAWLARKDEQTLWKSLLPDSPTKFRYKLSVASTENTHNCLVCSLVRIPQNVCWRAVVIIAAPSQRKRGRATVRTLADVWTQHQDTPMIPRSTRFILPLQCCYCPIFRSFSVRPRFDVRTMWPRSRDGEFRYA